LPHYADPASTNIKLAELILYGFYNSPPGIHANVLLIYSGKNLSIKATGDLKTTVVEGAYVAIQVKYGLITLIKQKIDLCEQVKNVDKECPLEPGELQVTKDVELPNEIPPVRSSMRLSWRKC
jgi:hypothetical protein